MDSHSAPFGLLRLMLTRIWYILSSNFPTGILIQHTTWYTEQDLRHSSYCSTHIEASPHSILAPTSTPSVRTFAWSSSSPSGTLVLGILIQSTLIIARSSSCRVKISIPQYPRAHERVDVLILPLVDRVIVGLTLQRMPLESVL